MDEVASDNPLGRDAADLIDELYEALEKLMRASPIDDTNRIAMREASAALTKARAAS